MTLNSDAQDSLIHYLRSAVGLLDLPPEDELRQDILTVCDQVSRPAYRIAVFAPFNYGKSTLLNAILGERALPIDLIPTTGAAILVRYGETLQTHIRLRSGQTVTQAGTEVLKQYAILDQQRRMRDDVAAVTLDCPHPWLQTGVELLDLPGTDDQVAQDRLVKEKLLTADLVVQVLDGRKLMTLGEREALRDWLLDRGIDSVVFVVNFLNLLDEADQQSVYRRLRFVAESFRAKLPAGVSNLYRVDALPALRSRLKGDAAAAQTSGLPMFESALQTIATAQSATVRDSRLTRLVAIAPTVQQALQHKLEALGQLGNASATDAIAASQGSQSDAEAEKQAKKREIQQKALSLIQKGFDQSLVQLKNWLALPNVQERYQAEAISALQRFDFQAWEDIAIKADWRQQQRLITEWVYKACDFLDVPRPADPWVAFPPQPVPPTDAATASRSRPSKSSDGGDAARVALATGLGWVLGGPIGAAALGGAGYIISQVDDRTGQPVPSSPDPMAQVQQAYAAAVRDYLTQFSQTALQSLAQYEATARAIMTQPLATETPPASPVDSASDVPPAEIRYQQQLLQGTLEALNQLLQDHQPAQR